MFKKWIYVINYSFLSILIFLGLSIFMFGFLYDNIESYSNGAQYETSLGQISRNLTKIKKADQDNNGHLDNSEMVYAINDIFGSWDVIDFENNYYGNYFTEFKIALDITTYSLSTYYNNQEIKFDDSGLNIKYLDRPTLFGMDNSGVDGLVDEYEYQLTQQEVGTSFEDQYSWILQYSKDIKISIIGFYIIMSGIVAMTISSTGFIIYWRKSNKKQDL